MASGHEPIRIGSQPPFAVPAERRDPARRLRARLVARKIDARCLEPGAVETNLAGARQKITVRQGIERELAKKIQATLKDAKIKVDSQINGDKLRVIGKKRDDLQAAMAVLRAGEFTLPLQFENFRD